MSLTHAIDGTASALRKLIARSADTGPPFWPKVAFQHWELGAIDDNSTTVLINGKSVTLKRSRDYGLGDSAFNKRVAKTMNPSDSRDSLSMAIAVSAYDGSFV